MRALISFEGILLCLYLICLVVLLVFSLGQLHLAITFWRHRHPRPGQGNLTLPGRAATAELPYVTVQLPVYNERYVVERLIRAVAALEYPRNRFEVQVLDDSTDSTRRIVARLVAELAATGLDIIEIHRADRAGFKAGALANGLRSAKGELIAVFDADFVPPPRFLLDTVPYFASADVAAVQARWGHLNEPESALTKVQAFLLDLHFRLEQPARAAGGYFLNFNGTAGVWRRSAIHDAGGWSARTLTEDIDLSYRAQLRGWRLVYLPEQAVPAELPRDMNGLRGQQHRWLKGGAQNARLHLAAVALGPLRSGVRWHACQHLLAGSMYVVILASLLLSVPLAAAKNTSVQVDYADYGIPFFVSTGAFVAACWTARNPRSPLAHITFLGGALRFLVLTMGLSVHNASAVVSGWSGRSSEFVRTPKTGTTAWAVSVYTRRTVDADVGREIAFAGYLLLGIAIGFHRREFAMVPLQALALAGLLWVVTLSVTASMRASRMAAEIDATEPVKPQPSGS